MKPTHFLRPIAALCLLSSVLLFGSGCATTGSGPSPDWSQIDTEKLATAGAQTTTALILRNNPARDGDLLQIADSLHTLFVDQEVTDALLGDLSLRLALRFDVPPADAVLISGAVLTMWEAVKPAFGDHPIIGSDPRVQQTVAAFARGMRTAVQQYRDAVAIAAADPIT